MLAGRGTSRWRTASLHSRKHAACRSYSLLRCKGRMLARNVAFSRATAPGCALYSSDTLCSATGERRQKQWRTYAQSSSEQAEAASEAALMPVRVTTQHQVNYGETLKMVGASSALGDWNPDDGPAMAWAEGDFWSAELKLPAGSFDFKCVVVRDDGSIAEWEPGHNRTLEIPEGGIPSTMEFVCPWSNTSVTFMSFDEEDVAARAAAYLEAAEKDSGSSQVTIDADDEGPPPPNSNSNGAGPHLEISSGGAASLQLPKNSHPQAQNGAPADQEPSGNGAPSKGVLQPSDSGPSSASRSEGDLSRPLQGSAISLGLLAIPVVCWSELTLRATGCGLPPGPSGLLGAAEGVSYLTVAGIASWGIWTRLSRRTGLPSGPGGLLAGIEGASYAVIVAGCVVLGLQVSEYGYVPAALPDSRCFGADSSPGRQQTFTSFGSNQDVGSEAEGSPSLPQRLQDAVQGMKDAFVGPSTPLEEVSSGAEDGLSGADLAPVVEELEEAATAAGQFFGDLMSKLRGSGSGGGFPPSSGTGALQPAVWSSAGRVAGWSRLQPVLPMRRVNIEMITTAAATNAAIAVDSLNQNLHSAVSPIFGDDEAGTASTGEPAEVQVDATSEEAFGESRRPETIDIEGGSKEAEPGLAVLEPKG